MSRPAKNQCQECGHHDGKHHPDCGSRIKMISIPKAEYDRLAEREKELADAKELSELRLKSEQKHVWENLRYREALEKFTDLACGDHESHDPHGWAKAALGEKRHLERRDEGEGAPVTPPRREG